MIANQTTITSRFQLPDADLPPGVDQKTADEVLDHYLANPAIVMADIANLCSVPVRVVGRILDSDYGRSIIELIERLSDRRAAIFASEARIQAIATTKRVARESPNDETARRAAAALLRFKTYTPAAAEPKPGNRGGTGGSPARDAHAPPPTTRVSKPAPARSVPPMLFPRNQDSTTTRVPRAAFPPLVSPTRAPTPTKPAAPAPALRVPPPAAQPRVVTGPPSTSTTAPAPSPAPIPSAAPSSSPHLTYTPNPPARAAPTP
jgi:hypothetical protein